MARTELHQVLLNAHSFKGQLIINFNYTLTHIFKIQLRHMHGNNRKGLTGHKSFLIKTDVIKSRIDFIRRIISNFVS